MNIPHRQKGKGGSDKGYTLLFAVLTAALVLGVAVFILDISRKQYELSVSARDSMYSFYAADSGLECANTANIATETDMTVYCGGTSLTATWGQYAVNGALPPQASSLSDAQYPVYYTPSDALDFGLPGGTCSDMTIYVGFDSQGNEHYIISSKGYNHCSKTNGPDTSNPYTVERGLLLSI